MGVVFLILATATHHSYQTSPRQPLQDIFDALPDGRYADPDEVEHQIEHHLFDSEWDAYILHKLMLPRCFSPSTPQLNCKYL